MSTRSIRLFWSGRIPSEWLLPGALADRTVTLTRCGGCRGDVRFAIDGQEVTNAHDFGKALQIMEALRDALSDAQYGELMRYLRDATWLSGHRSAVSRGGLFLPSRAEIAEFGNSTADSDFGELTYSLLTWGGDPR